jgi:hypothetical protein
MANALKRPGAHHYSAVHCDTNTVSATPNLVGRGVKRSPTELSLGSQHRGSGWVGACQHGSHAERSCSTPLADPANGGVWPARRSHRCQLGPGAPPAKKKQTQPPTRQVHRPYIAAIPLCTEHLRQHKCARCVPGAAQWRPPGHTNPTMLTPCPPTLGPETRVSTQGHPCRHPPAHSTQVGKAQ